MILNIFLLIVGYCLNLHKNNIIFKKYSEKKFKSVNFTRRDRFFFLEAKFNKKHNKIILSKMLIKPCSKKTEIIIFDFKANA